MPHLTCAAALAPATAGAAHCTRPARHACSPRGIRGAAPRSVIAATMLAPSCRRQASTWTSSSLTTTTPYRVCALTEVRPRRPASPTPRARRMRRTAVLPSSCPRPACGRRCSLHLRRAVRVCLGQTALRQRGASTPTCGSREAAAPPQPRQPTGASPTLHARVRLALCRGGVVVRVTCLCGVRQRAVVAQVVSSVHAFVTASVLSCEILSVDHPRRARGVYILRGGPIVVKVQLDESRRAGS